MKYFFLAFGCITLLFTGCFKKGDDDPKISLRSRTNRLTGIWQLTYKHYSYYENTSTDTLLYTEDFDGTYLNMNQDGQEQKVLYYEKLGISKYGSYSWSNEGKDTPFFPNVYFSSAEEGYWTFAGKNKKEDIRDKEGVLFYFKHLNATAGTQTYTQYAMGMPDGLFYLITGLSEKKMKLLREFSESAGGGNYRSIYHYSEWEKIEE